MDPFSAERTRRNRRRLIVRALLVILLPLAVLGAWAFSWAITATPVGSAGLDDELAAAARWPDAATPSDGSGYERSSQAIAAHRMLVESTAAERPELASFSLLAVDEPDDAEQWRRFLEAEAATGDASSESSRAALQARAEAVRTSTIPGELIAVARGPRPAITADQAASGPPVPPARWAASQRHGLEQWLRSFSDASGRLLPAWIGHDPPAPPPSLLHRLRWNLPYLGHPRRAAILARADPLLARFTEPSSSLPTGERDWGSVTMEPDKPHQLAQRIEWNLDHLARMHEAMVRIRIGRETHTAGLRVAIAIERYRMEHGASPRTLTDLGLPPHVLIDPWTGDPLRSVPGDPDRGDRWRLWSAGRDGVDDGGSTGESAKDGRLHPQAWERAWATTDQADPAQEAVP